MIRVVDREIEKPRQKQKKSVVDSFSTSEKKLMARKMMELIAMLIAEHPIKVKDLLERYQIKTPKQPTDKALVDRVIYQLSKQNRAFNNELGLLIQMHIPGIAEIGGNDSFDAGAAVGSAVGQTASGAATGGWVGAVVGLVGGGLNLANSAKEAKNERERASNMTISSLLEYKSAKEKNASAAKSNTTKIIVAIVVILGLVGGGILLMQLHKSKADNPVPNTQSV